MKLNFRQGIVQATAPFLSFSSGSVNLNISSDDVIVTFAHGKANYLFRESATVTGAWSGPFNVSGTTWLYWDIHFETGLRTFGKTDIDPTGFGSVLPLSPVVGQNFFYTKENKMKVWDGVRWNTVIRVLAGEVENGTILTPYAVGTQIANNEEVYAGYILYALDGKPFKTAHAFNRGEFIHTESRLKTQNTPLNQYEQSNTEYSYKAKTSIPKGYCVSLVEDKLLTLASNRIPDLPCIGISVDDLHANEVGRYITEGIMEYSGWNFSSPPNTAIWVGVNGEITPVVPDRISMQRLGYVLSATKILLDIQEPIIIDSDYLKCFVPSPTPTPTPTVTPTITSTVTPTPSVTPTLSSTPSVTPTNTPTQTAHPTATVTPSVTPTTSLAIIPSPTPSITPTFSPTPSVTPEVTPTKTPSVTPTLTPTLTSTPTITPTISG